MNKRIFFFVQHNDGSLKIRIAKDSGALVSKGSPAPKGYHLKKGRYTEEPKVLETFEKGCGGLEEQVWATCNDIYEQCIKSNSSRSYFTHELWKRLEDFAYLFWHKGIRSTFE